MRIAGLVQDSIVDGPGLRFAVFTQGCGHQCPGCHNPDTHDPSGGMEMAVGDIVAAMASNPLTDGVTLTGGEPFQQAADAAAIAEAAKAAGLNVWTYTGWTFEQLRVMDDPAVQKLLSLTDVLVDGPFVQARRTLSLRWRGSTNQRLIDVAESLKQGKAVELE